MYLPLTRSNSQQSSNCRISSRRKRRRWGVIMALSAGLSAPSGFASDHREAPLMQEDGTADIADFYAFRNPNDASKLVLAMTVNAASVPQQAALYNFSPNVLYRFNIDNDGDAAIDHHIDVTFSSSVPGPQRLKAVFPNGEVVEGEVTLPTTIGPEPNPPILLESSRGSGVRIFAGPRDDPFFFDAVGSSRFVSGTGFFTGTDGFAGQNVSAIVVEVPLSMVADESGRLQIWGETGRPNVTLRRSRSTQVQQNFRPFRQIERAGNPSVNFTFIPPTLRDLFNVRKPRHDAKNFMDSIVASLKAIGTDEENIEILLKIIVPDTLKLDLTEADGFPNGRRLEDDVMDTLFFYLSNQADPRLADGVDENDVVFLNEFPFLARPHQAP